LFHFLLRGYLTGRRQVSLLWVQDFTATMPASTCVGTKRKARLPTKFSYPTFSLLRSGVSLPCST
jgi:hypothetical protein